MAAPQAHGRHGDALESVTKPALMRVGCLGVSLPLERLFDGIEFDQP
jgi:hypothetical protein